MIPAIPISVFAVAFLLALILGAMQWWRGLLGLFLLSVALFYYCSNPPDGPDGLPDIRYAVVAYLVCIPAGGGLLGGSVMGWLVHRVRSRRRAAG